MASLIHCTTSSLSRSFPLPLRGARWAPTTTPLCWTPRRAACAAIRPARAAWGRWPRVCCLGLGSMPRLIVFYVIDCQSCNLGYRFDGRACFLHQCPGDLVEDYATSTCWRSAGLLSTATLNFSSFPLRHGLTYVVCNVVLSPLCG